MATQWFTILGTHAEVLKALFTVLSDEEGRQLLRAPDLQYLQKRTVCLEAVFLREQLLTELTFSCRAYARVSNGEPDLEVSRANYKYVTWSFMNTGRESRGGELCSLADGTEPERCLSWLFG